MQEKTSIGPNMKMSLVGIAVISSLIIFILNYTEQKSSLQTQNFIEVGLIVEGSGKLNTLGGNLNKTVYSGDQFIVPAKVKVNADYPMIFSTGSGSWLRLSVNSEIDLLRADDALSLANKHQAKDKLLASELKKVANSGPIKIQYQAGEVILSMHKNGLISQFYYGGLALKPISVEPVIVKFWVEDSRWKLAVLQGEIGLSVSGAYASVAAGEAIEQDGAVFPVTAKAAKIIALEVEKIRKSIGTD